MLTNLEVKTKIPNIEQAVAIADSLKLKFIEILNQVDTYFGVPKGRLKLREINSVRGELIYYERDEYSNQRQSKFEIYQTKDPSMLKLILEQAFGVQNIVSKKRYLYMFNDTRIHVDNVSNLGSFLEFEVPMNSVIEEPQATMQFLIKSFHINEADFIKGSYSDMVQTKS